MSNVLTSLARKEGSMITIFILSVAAGVVANFISKWLDGKMKDR